MGFKGIWKNFRLPQGRLKGVSSSFKGVSSVFRGSIKEVSSMFQKCFKKVWSVFQESFKLERRVSKVIFCGVEGYMKEVQRSYKGVSRKIEGCSERPLRVIQGGFKGI